MTKYATALALDNQDQCYLGYQLQVRTKEYSKGVGESRMHSVDVYTGTRLQATIGIAR